MVILDLRTKELPSVRMAGRELPRERLAHGGDGFETQYRLLIDTWAGRTLLDIQHGDVRRSITLEIGPHARKFSQNEFDTMLAELSQRATALVWGLSPGLGSGAWGAQAPAVAHPIVIETQLPLFEALLARFVADPPTTTVRTREARPLDFARRVDLRTLRWLGQRPDVLRALRGDLIAGSFISPRTRVDQPEAIRSYDHPVTRYVFYLLRRLLARFRETVETLRTARRRPYSDPTIEAHAEALAARVDAASARIEVQLGHPLFRRVRAEPLSETARQTLPDHPLHAALHRVASRMLQPGLAHSPGGDLQAALKHTYDLFELFVLYRLIDGLPGQLGPGWSLQVGKPLRFIGREHRPADRAAWLFRGPDGLTLELRYQQWFSRAKTPIDGRMFTSLSGLNIPDYVLVMRRHGEPIAWVILDAKYRSGQQAVDQGLGDVHRYRDALRIRGKKASAAFVLVPRLQNENAVYANSSYHAHHSFGVLQVMLADWLGPVCGALLPPSETLDA